LDGEGGLEVRNGAGEVVAEVEEDTGVGLGVEIVWIDGEDGLKLGDREIGSAFAKVLLCLVQVALEELTLIAAGLAEAGTREGKESEGERQ
jgi:hypothetical protein